MVVAEGIVVDISDTTLAKTPFCPRGDSISLSQLLLKNISRNPIPAVHLHNTT